jgi:hypothetical protein
MMKIKTEKMKGVPLLITSAKQLQGLVDAPVFCEFALDGQVVRVPCKRMNQEMEEARFYQVYH